MPPSEDHEITLELFRNRPELARKVAAEVFDADIALIGSSADTPRRAIIHEVQRKAGKADPSG